MDRRLAAILAADVADFSALVGRDEDGALRTLKGHLAALEPLIALNGGRIVKTTGDGFLAEFPSVVFAVSCAVAMQRQMAERNAGQAPELRMAFRMGVHVGDVVIDADDILGDGVNIAARLQGVAPPGGIVVSRRVHEDVADKVDLAFQKLGEQRLKDISRPILAFGVSIDQSAPAAPPAPDRPTKPSVAVLAFDNLSPGAEQDYLAEGIAEDIITALSRVPWIFVIARNSSFSYRGIAVDVRRIGRELGVRYVLEGSVRRAGDRLRVTAELIDTETGAHVWADRFDGEMEDVFDLQDRITEAVVSAIAPEIRNHEIELALLKRPESRDAYDHFLRALAAANRFRIGEANAELDAAIRLAPGYPIAKAFRAWLQTLVWHPEIAPDPERAPRALRLAEEVLGAPDADIEAAAYAGYVVAFYGEDFERGLAQVERAIELCPNCVSAWGSSCLLNALHGRPEAALERAVQALRLSPRDPMAYRIHSGSVIAHVARRDWEAVLATLERGRVFENAVLVSRHFEIVALVHLGRLDRARLLAERYMALDPGFRVGKFRALRQSVRALDLAIYEPVFEGMIAAGLPE